MRKKFIIGILIVLIIVVISLSTLALFTWTSPNTTLTLEVGEMTDVIFQEGNDIIANNIGPVLNYEDGEITEFAIINNAENEQQAKFYLDISEISDSLKEESFKYLLQTSTDGNNYETYKEGNFVSATTGELVISDSEVSLSGRTYYRFIIYIDGNMENPTSMMNNSLKVTFNVVSFLRPITVEELGNQIALKSNGVKDTVNDIAITDEGIWEMQDDYGTTYYFRGAAQNNYVKFAGYYWRIIRINGDGSLRLIYDGTSAHANGEISIDRQIGTSAFNSSYNDNAYIGYMYGQTGASTYEETHANINDSTIKEVVDNWYKVNINDKGYGDKVADIIYCNDRSIPTGYGDGNGLKMTNYSAMKRIIHDSTLSLKCANKNDAFTVSDEERGNGALTYPIGLIMVDEVLAAGGLWEVANNNYYLYIGRHIWTMSPSYFNGDNAGNFVVTDKGSISNFMLNGIVSVRPVISLKPSVELTGSGTMEDPWIVQ